MEVSRVTSHLMACSLKQKFCKGFSKEKKLFPRETYLRSSINPDPIQGQYIRPTRQQPMLLCHLMAEQNYAQTIAEIVFVLKIQT